VKQVDVPGQPGDRWLIELATEPGGQRAELMRVFPPGFTELARGGHRPSILARQVASRHSP
jgi:hypothetical protein